MLCFKQSIISVWFCNSVFKTVYTDETIFSYKKSLTIITGISTVDVRFGSRKGSSYEERDLKVFALLFLTDPSVLLLSVTMFCYYTVNVAYMLTNKEHV